MAYCRKCGAELSEEANQCPKCGAETKEKPGCFMLAIGPLLITLGLTYLCNAEINGGSRENIF